MAVVYWIHLQDHTDLMTQGYIGVTSKTAEVRWTSHRKDFKSKVGRCYILKNAFLKYGDALKVTTLLECTNSYSYFIEGKLRPERNVGWNIAIGGSVSPMLGKVLSVAEKRALSVSRTGNRNYARVITETQKENISKSRTKFKIETPDGVYGIKDACVKYGVSKHTIYSRCDGYHKGFTDWFKLYPDGSLGEKVSKTFSPTLKYNTPVGVFTNREDAGKANTCSPQTATNRCNNELFPDWFLEEVKT